MKHTILMIILQLAASGGDAYYTNRNINLGAPELNPIAKPFVRTTAGRVGYFSLQTGLKITLPILLRKHGHEKLADFAGWYGIADNAAAAVWDITKERR